MKKFLISEEGKFYKANLHMHTTLSDGPLTPEQVKEEYKKRGYSIVAFTDHEVIIPHNDLTDSEFLAITSMEIVINERDKYKDFSYVNTYHLNLYAKDKNQVVSSAFCEDVIWIESEKQYITDEMRLHQTPREYSTEFVNNIIKKANEEGFLVSYNHPLWSHNTYNDYIKFKGLWGVECHNQCCANMGFNDSISVLDDLYRVGQKVYPLATDDAHSMSDCFGGFVMVKSKSLEYGDVMQALEEGNFYASTGVEIYSLVLEDNIVKVDCSPVKAIRLNTDRRHTRHVLANGNGLITHAEFDISNILKSNDRAEDLKENMYFRISAYGADGRYAFTKAYFYDDIYKD